MADEQDDIDQTTAEGYMMRAGNDPDEARRRYDNSLAQRLNPQVISKANPGADWLREARATLNRDKAIQDFVREARANEVPPGEAIDGLGLRLNERWGGEHAAEAYEAALYLWDEQDQLGDGIFITSTETGRVVAALSEKDIYLPAPVPREDGTMAQPLPRIRPELEGAITCWAFDNDREHRVVQTLAARANQTDLLREEGDPRLLVATRAGRRHIMSELAKFDPKILLRAAGGTSGNFLQHFELRADDPEHTGGLTLIEGEVFSQSVMGVQDMTTLNLHHNRAASIQGALVQGWVREVARKLSDAAGRHLPAVEEIDQSKLTRAHLGGRDIWVCPPEAVRYLRRADLNVAIMPVVAAKLIGLLPNTGILTVPAEFTTSSHEMFDRWEARSILKFKLWVDWTKVGLLRITGIEHQAVLS